MVASPGVLAPPNWHPPLTLQLILGADLKVSHFDPRFEARPLEKATYMTDDVPDEQVALSRSSMASGRQNIKNSGYDPASVGIMIDGE